MAKNIFELNLIDDFLFTEASIDENTSKPLMKLIIERSTGLKVEHLTIEAQKTLNGIDIGKHGIRMDVTIREICENGQTIRFFDVEPNNITKIDLPKRSRYYQALTDIKLLDSGVNYDNLPDMWTIWILPYDPFGMDCMLYSVKNMVEDYPKLEYNDGIKKLFLFTNGTKGGSKALKNLLTYMQNSTEENAVDDELDSLHKNITRLKGRKEIGVKYMQMQELLKETAKMAAREAEAEAEKAKAEAAKAKEEAAKAKAEAAKAKSEFSEMKAKMVKMLRENGMTDVLDKMAREDQDIQAMLE